MKILVAFFTCSFVPHSALHYKFSHSTTRTSKTVATYCNWETVDPVVQARVIDRYFGEPIFSHQKCDVFCIEGIPAASFTYTNTTETGDPIVEAFYLNKGLLLMFDAGCQMRKHLVSRYKNIDMRFADNRNEFLLV